MVLLSNAVPIKLRRAAKEYEPKPLTAKFFLLHGQQIQTGLILIPGKWRQSCWAEARMVSIGTLQASLKKKKKGGMSSPQALPRAEFISYLEISNVQNRIMWNHYSLS